MSTNQSNQGEELAGLFIVGTIRTIFRIIGGIFSGLRSLRTTVCWLLGIWLAFAIGDPVGILVLIVMVATILIATTNLLSKVPAVAKYAAKAKSIATRIAPGVAEVNRFKATAEEKKAFKAGNQLLHDLGVKNEGDAFGILSFEEDGNTVVYLSRKKKFGKEKLQEVPGGLVSVARILDESKGALGVAYIEVDAEFKDKTRTGRIILESTANMDKSLQAGNALLRELEIVGKDDTNFYNVRSYADELGQNIEIAEPIGYKDADEVAQKIIKARGRFGAKYASYTTEVTGAGNWIDIILIKGVPAEVDEANYLLRESGAVDKTDTTLHDVLLIKTENEVTFRLNKTIDGRISSDLIRAIEGYKERYNARSVRSKDLGGGLLEVVFVISDFLDEAKVINYTPVLNEDEMSVVCATDAFGKDVSVSFKEVSGMLIAGIPGSGKTAGATSFLAPIAMSDDVDVSIIDCKGGADWDNYRPLAKGFIQGSENLEEIAVLLEDHVKEMNTRVAEQKEKIGVSNFWGASPAVRRKAGLKSRLLIIDECQDLFEAGSTKEAREIYARILVASQKLVRKGRSAGITTVFITQKTTADSIPSSIRDQCALRISFRVMTVAAKIAILGETSEDPYGPDPMKIPANRKGGAVMLNGNDLTEVRFFYIPEQILEGLVKDHVASKGRKNKVATVNQMLAQAESSPYPDEAATALEAAQKMMARYGITEDELFAN